MQVKNFDNLDINLNYCFTFAKNFQKNFGWNKICILNSFNNLIYV